jgi:hypothetical protein
VTARSTSRAVKVVERDNGNQALGKRCDLSHSAHTYRPLWVISGHWDRGLRCPLYPQKRALGGAKHVYRPTTT